MCAISWTRRQALYAGGFKLTRAAGYSHADAVEFLMDVDSGEIYFVEVSPGIQVEHSVTEEVSGVDHGVSIMRPIRQTANRSPRLPQSRIAEALRWCAHRHWALDGESLVACAKIAAPETAAWRP